MRIISIILFFAFTFSIKAQLNPAGEWKKSVEPRPFLNLMLFDNFNNEPKESIIQIKKQNDNGFNIDTLRIRIFDKKGNEIKYITFRNNQPETIKYTEYNNNRKQQSYWTEGNQKHLYSFKHDKNGNETHILYEQIVTENELQTRNLIYSDTFVYQKNLLIEFHSTKFGGLHESYLYNSKGNLIKVKGGFKPKLYFYDDLSQLIRVEEYTSKIEANYLSEVCTYQYDIEGRLILSEVLPLKNFEIDEPYSTKYFYDNKNILDSLSTTFQEQYCNIGISYVDGKIKELRFKANTKNLAYFKCTNYIPYGIEPPFQFVEKYEYDEWGNKVKINKFLNDKLYLEFINLIKYRAE